MHTPVLLNKIGVQGVYISLTRFPDEVERTWEESVWMS